jgi:hypothetical protein
MRKGELNPGGRFLLNWFCCEEIIGTQVENPLQKEITQTNKKNTNFIMILIILMDQAISAKSTEEIYTLL